MKRYIVFFGDIYYPNGGMDDLVGDFDTIEECKACIDAIVLKQASESTIELDGEQAAIEEEWRCGLIWTKIYDVVERKEVFSRKTDQ